MKRISWKVLNVALGITALVLALGGCSNDKSQPATTATAAGATTSTPATQPPTVEVSDVLTTAVERALAAGSYRFQAEVEALVGDKEIQASLSGWVDQGDRLLVTRIGDIEISTSVLDGVATVTSPDGAREVPLSEADQGPSLQILLALDEVTVGSDGVITGYLSPDQIAELGMVEEAADGADVTIRITPDGDLAGYTMTDRRGRWTIDATFDTFGGDVRS